VERDAAVVTNGLPVYSDMGGVLVLTTSGSVLHYDPETRDVSSVKDSRWRTVAFIKAATRYRELQSLMPVRPAASNTCPACGVDGMIFERVDCGTCMGTGWVPA
jgi:hypothetical protein